MTSYKILCDVILLLLLLSRLVDITLELDADLRSCSL